MTASSPAELNAASIITQIESEAFPREMLVSFARGFLPLDRDDLIGVLAYLAASDDSEIAQAARDSLKDMPSRIVVGVAADEGADVPTLQRLARATEDAAILEALIRNRAFPDEAVAELAADADAALQEIIVINQLRILRWPQILDALLENPRLSADARRRALETKEEFFEKKLRQQPVEIGIDPELADAPTDAIADLLEAAENEPQPATRDIPVTEAEKEDPRSQALFAKVFQMTIAEKVVMAFRGDRSARLILIRDRNRLVCSAAIRNPRITETEVEQIAAMRNVDEEVLRLIGMRRDWMAKYSISLALLRNPRAPVGVVLQLINRLTLRDLKGLKDDKGVSDAVRSAARRAFLARTRKS